ncbi:MAG: Electron transport complex, RnfABCDGE type, subunit [Proteobacteria bacterium]|nr:Electron transport complex, RnfABCDGE type, subunit [Pseudomonadota bacterium]
MMNKFKADRPLYRFNGGVHPPGHKEQSSGAPIAIAPLPSRLIVPLHQSIGGTPRPVVKPGERVLKGQIIGAADGWISSAVHAPTSGTVRDIAMHTQPHPSGLPALSVIIDPDGKEEWSDLNPPDYAALSPDDIRKLIQQAGIVGLGGAVFPTHGKLTPSARFPMEDLVINGGECEPYMTCDDLLMRERAEGVVRGAAIFRDLMQPKRVMIGIEDNKPEAIAAMRAAVQVVGENFEVVPVPALYPAGCAKQLIRVLTGKEVPVSKRSTDLGAQCFNVATAYSAWRAIAFGEPMISRVVTLTGNVAHAHNVEALFGTPMEELIQLAKPKDDTDGILVGGPMMGFLAPDISAPIVKGTNCLIAHSPGLFPPRLPEMPCIRCGECARVCPQDLQPYELYRFARAKNFGKAQEYNLFDCIECGSCAYVCSSHIPLVQYYLFAKSEIWSREREKKAADQARDRFLAKQKREEREKAEKAEKLAKAAAAQAAKKVAETAAPADGVAPPDADAAKKAAIAAALERAQAQRAAAQPKNTDSLTPEQQQEMAEIDARRTQATQTTEPAAPEAASKKSPS